MPVCPNACINVVQRGIYEFRINYDWSCFVLLLRIGIVVYAGDANDVTWA